MTPTPWGRRLSPLASQSSLLVSAVVLRAALLVYGLYQDAHSAAKYTDIDYLVFTDAARFVAQGRGGTDASAAPTVLGTALGSPYERATYRYTPLLAWLLVPTAWGGAWACFGKAVFAAADLVAGWVLVKVLRKRAQPDRAVLKYAAIWLLNPMVAVISTRGSSEGLLGVLVSALLWAVLERRVGLAGVLLGLGVHLKIYPMIYGPSILWALDEGCRSETLAPALAASPAKLLVKLLNRSRVTVLVTSLATFALLNAAMYAIYGHEFLRHTFLHHLTRMDHRHNFSPYNTLLYLSSAGMTGGPARSALSFERLAFVPQLLLSAVVIPLCLAKRELAGCMFAQTLAFVAFNKVCTSQYFLWYLIFLPLYLPYSRYTARPLAGIGALLVWVVPQAMWLSGAYKLEFLGRSEYWSLMAWGLAFFAANVKVLGDVVEDVLLRGNEARHVAGTATAMTTTPEAEVGVTADATHEQL
ncbi:GPI mannosyltransferase 1 [Ascosphaera acerosa]|nr:GPI mannosyltransferase 1 [Ascosphaera acerosa]